MAHHHAKAQGDVRDPECSRLDLRQIEHKPELMIWGIVALFATAFVWAGLGEAWTK
jgi:hypothetical protein